MERLDWNYKDARKYRDLIERKIVPVTNKIFSLQKERLGYKEDTKYYDYNIFYKTGNATPKIHGKDLVEQASRMYSHMDYDIKKCFDFMVDHHCMDLIAKRGKTAGGYMTYLPSLKTPFIFSNFNGTSGDVDVLTHEFGHSLQAFLSKDLLAPYRSPGMETCEIHSMAMEFLTYPYMDFFFKEDADKYRYEHLASALTFLPYGCIVDAFQEFCYLNPNCSIKERNEYFRSLERRFLPHKEYGEVSFLEDGCYWMRQGHIFTSPLYYLDYTLAQVVALDLFFLSLENKDESMRKYVKLCSLGGSLPFRALLEETEIDNPFEEETIERVSRKALSYLESFDVDKLDRN